MEGEFVLVTRQPGASTPVNAYSSPGVDAAALEGAGQLLADGASPPMTFVVLPLQPARWDSA